MKALILDDDPIICECLSAILQDLNVEYETFLDTKQALRRIEQNAFDFAFVDIILPNINGLEFAKLFKKKYPYVDIVFISGHGDYNKAIEAIKIGAYDFIKKPFDLLDIRLCVLRIIEKRKLIEDQERMERLQFANDAALELIRELNGPMTTIGQLSQLLSKPAPSDEKIREYTKRIFEESLRFDNVLNDVLAQLRYDANITVSQNRSRN